MTLMTDRHPIMSMTPKLRWSTRAGVKVNCSSSIGTSRTCILSYISSESVVLKLIYRPEETLDIAPTGDGRRISFIVWAVIRQDQLEMFTGDWFSPLFVLSSAVWGDDPLLDGPLPQLLKSGGTRILQPNG